MDAEPAKLSRAGLSEGLAIDGVEMFYEAGDRRELARKRGLLGTSIREITNGQIPHADDSFDLVVSNQVFEHVEDLPSVLAEIGRVLKPTGSIIVAVSNKGSPARRTLRRADGALVRSDVAASVLVVADVPRARFWIPHKRQIGG